MIFTHNSLDPTNISLAQHFCVARFPTQSTIPTIPLDEPSFTGGIRNHRGQPSSNIGINIASGTVCDWCSTNFCRRNQSAARCDVRYIFMESAKRRAGRKMWRREEDEKGVGDDKGHTYTDQPQRDTHRISRHRGIAAAALRSGDKCWPPK